MSRKYRTVFLMLPMLIAAQAARADAISDAKAGMDALARGANPEAIKLFSKAIGSGRLTEQDLELAYVKRAEAYVASGNAQLANADISRALKIDPSDAEAIGVRSSLNAHQGGDLTDSLKEVVDEVQDIPSVYYRIMLRDGEGEHVFAYTREYSRVSLINNEGIKYHRITTRDGSIVEDEWWTLLLENVTDVNLFTAVDEANQVALSSSSQGSFYVQSSPEVYVVKLTKRLGGDDAFFFYNRERAERFVQKIDKALEAFRHTPDGR